MQVESQKHTIGTRRKNVGIELWPRGIDPTADEKGKCWYFASPEGEAGYG